MIATLDRLMALSQKLQDAARTTERDPIYIALELNEVHLLERLLEDYLREADPYSSAGRSSEESY
jgi:hypothetical protein